jgi:hypothetical protein
MKKLPDTILDKHIAEKNASLKANFKEEWSEADFKTVKQAIKKHCTFKPLQSNEGTKTFYTFSDFEQWAGLAYTSSSSFAGLWVCNGIELGHVLYPGFHYIGFALGADNKVFAILWDADENEILLPL